MTDTNIDLDECQKHYAKWKKPNTKDFTPYDFVYIKILFKRQNYYFRKKIQICQIQGGEERTLTTKGKEIKFGIDKNILLVAIVFLHMMIWTVRIGEF